ncbi:pyridoxine 5'-phosphate synthase [Candidatus Pantoea edessiphila]|uniref:Pyridoxine 5'-phosphate synthase n=1 Tax=Candidatus Pantoea edessiphila TaxID=2044610 RepID=A0A2P5SYC6_9GAMM|nr:pyridoxine 5'-phosphate synthase [Candidatus Pantoea edessiphila]MBK4775527.1 pyridoxine 5'-phosphate synthase [Pantoea sp. Edef]PPI87347.1 pyridoxine 5'-phosphate synthase [Candidatus Pantoea edessiphila]
MTNLMLGVNVDHIGTVRNARGINYPDPLLAALIAEQSGADSITVHLRKDRRHITDRDVIIINKTIQTRMNLEISINKDMIAFACEVKPYSCCLVPEKRQEITTEGGLDIISNKNIVDRSVKCLQDAGIIVSLFVNADIKQIEAAINSGAQYIEIHTGIYSSTTESLLRDKELNRIKQSVKFSVNNGLKVNAGHGLNYHNVIPIASIPEIYELNIGHSIISYALINGLENAVKNMKQLLREVHR